MATFDGKLKHGDDLRERVRELRMEGLSAAQIAKRIGGITRSAVLGLVHRMGLPPRDQEPSSRVNDAPLRKVDRATKPVRFTVAQASAKAALLPLPVAEHDAARPCQWPCGEGETAGICGRPRDPSDWRAAYCADHRIAGARPQKGGKIALRVRPAPDPVAARQARPFTFAGSRA